MQPALEPRLRDLQRLHGGLTVELQTRIELRDVEQCQAEDGHDEHEHESHDEHAAALVNERTQSRSGMSASHQCRFATIARPNVSERFAPALTVKTMFAPGTTPHDSPAIVHTVGVP